MNSGRVASRKTRQKSDFFWYNCSVNCQGFEAWLSEKRVSDVEWIECETNDDWQRAETIIDNAVVAPWMQSLSLEMAVSQLRTSTLLTPCRKGYWGADTINARAGRQRKVFAPVVSTRNSYQLGVMNGDLGVVERRHPYDHIHFHQCTVPGVLLPGLEKAFALTVHKSQGAEFDTVVVVIPPEALVDRRLLYTAMTRAKQRVPLIGRKADYLRSVESKEARVSTLSSRLT